MFFQQVYDEGLAQASYVIGCESTGEALVVDPRRDVDAYTALAARHDLHIVGVAETHIHADYLSGGRELAAATGATLYLSGLGDEGEGYVANQPDVRVKLVRNGDEIRIGEVRARVRHTPGHTPEHICFEIFDGSDKTVPMMLLSGDFIFVGDLGRPDLLEQSLGKTGSAQASARTLFGSLRRRAAGLAGFCGDLAGARCRICMRQSPGRRAQYDARLRASFFLVESISRKWR